MDAMRVGSDPRSRTGENNLLRALHPDDLEILTPFLESWAGACGDVLHEPGDTVRHVYFPCGSSMISYFVLLDDGRAVESALVGREGAVGGIVSQGRLPAYARAEVQFAGLFLRMDLIRLEQAKMKSLSLRHLFDRYADCLMAQVFQSVTCNAAHSIEQRTAKWLLAAMDRTDSTQVPLTHEQLAAMLGVGRSYISRVVSTFKSRGILNTSRGQITVMDVRQLRAITCSCNASVRQHFEEVLSGVYPT